MLALLRSNYARAEQAKADDPRLATSHVTYPGSTGTVKGYVARPAGSERLPGVIVIHQNRGLNPHIEDVARRLALAGYCDARAGSHVLARRDAHGRGRGDQGIRQASGGDGARRRAPSMLI